MHSSQKFTVTRRAALLSAAALPLFSWPLRAQGAVWRRTYGLSSFGDLSLPETFDHFPYAQPGAPRGGQLRMEAVANSYDSLNGFILQGNPAIGLSIVNDSLMAGNLDEDNAIYGLVAQAVEISPDKRQYRFHLRREAHFHDGSPLTAKDVVFSLNILRGKGHPVIQQLLRDLEKAEAQATMSCW